MADVILLQPLPTECHVANVRVGDAEIAPIARIWRTEDVLRCRLCPAGLCVASYCDESRVLSACLVVARRHVADSDALVSSQLPAIAPRLCG
jgi:hypothetical protein